MALFPSVHPFLILLALCITFHICKCHSGSVVRRVMDVHLSTTGIGCLAGWLETHLALMGCVVAGSVSLLA